MAAPTPRHEVRSGAVGLDGDTADRLPDTLRNEPHGLAGGSGGYRICGDDARAHTDSGIRTETSQGGDAPCRLVLHSNHYLRTMRV